MTSSAELLAECAAAPDDDGPRLVWADFVGGERGELVVVQCALARGDQPPQTAAALRRRERELLAAHGETWGAELVPFARRWHFRRGFIEAVEPHVAILQDAGIRAQYRAALPAHPLLDTVALPRVYEPDLRCALELAGRLRALDLGTFGDTRPVMDERRDIGARFEPGQVPALRALGVNDLGYTTCERIAELPLQRLRLRIHRAPAPAALAEVLDRAPQLAGLEIAIADREDARLDAIFARPLTALRMDIAHRDWLALVRGPIARTLEHLGGAVTGAPALDTLPFPRLRTLALHGDELEAIAQALARSDVPQLRILRLVGSTLQAETVQRLAARFGHQLELLELPYRTSLDDVRIAGELRTAMPPPASHEALLGVTPAEMFSVDPPRIERSQPAVLVRVDGAGSWDLPVRDCDARFDLGRMRDCDVSLPVSSIARRHARITWHGGRHVVEDLGSTNGTTVNGSNVERALSLADGDELVIGGEAMLRYFVGPGANERAGIELASVADRDPVTRLPRDRSARIRLRIPGAPQSIRWANVQALRALAEQLVAEAGDARLTFVDVGCFGIDDLAAATRLAETPRTVEIYGIANPTRLELERDDA